jgi:hypothetical protein
LDARDFIGSVIRQPNGRRICTAIDLNMANLGAARWQLEFRELLGCGIKSGDPV